jgi:hypothetical protein
VRRSFVQELRDKATIGATFGQSFVNIILLGFVFWRIPLDSKGMHGIFIIIIRNMNFTNQLRRTKFHWSFIFYLHSVDFWCGDAVNRRFHAAAADN